MESCHFECHLKHYVGLEVFFCLPDHAAHYIWSDALWIFIRKMSSILVETERGK